MLHIDIKGTMKTGLRVFAGLCNWREITDKEKTITCGRLEGGEIAHGILVETGIKEEKKKVTLELTEDQLNKIQEFLK